MPYVLQNLPMLDLPSVRGLTVMLLIYIISVGPINYIILKRAKRLHLAWISIPAITLLFSGLTIGFGVALHGTDIFVNKISFLQLGSSGNAKYSAFVGIFSPAQTSYQVELSEGGLVSPLTTYYEPWMSSIDPGRLSAAGSALSMVQGDPAVVKGLSVDQWSMQSFMSEGLATDIGYLDAALTLSGNSLSGTITNLTNSDFLDSYIMLGQKYLHTGAVPTGETAEVVLELSNLGAPLINTSLSYSIFEKELNQTSSTSDRRTWESKRAIIESIFERTPPFFNFSSPGSSQSSFASTPILVAWIENGPPEIRILENEIIQQSSAVVIAQLDYSLPGTGSISFPVGMIPGQISSTPVNGGSCGMPGTTGVYIPDGEAQIEFSLPVVEKSFYPEKLRFGIWTDHGAVFVVPQIDFYDWTSWIGRR